MPLSMVILLIFFYYLSGSKHEINNLSVSNILSEIFCCSFSIYQQQMLSLFNIRSVQQNLSLLNIGSLLVEEPQYKEIALKQQRFDCLLVSRHQPIWLIQLREASKRRFSFLICITFTFNSHRVSFLLSILYLIL